MTDPTYNETERAIYARRDDFEIWWDSWNDNPLDPTLVREFRKCFNAGRKKGREDYEETDHPGDFVERDFT